jgi:alkanesulfonate monooxygenase SsuD/methylene tetrahydromethanopterin reductase-like flavin-dependent oxidoreductase (luciferase family)
MTDYGRPVRFGVTTDPGTDRLGAARRMAGAADSAGLDLLAVQDHPYPPGHPDAWTLTNRIALFTDVSDLRLRPPAMLAKAADHERQAGVFAAEVVPGAQRRVADARGRA